MPRVQLPAVTPKHKAWNKGRIIGQKRPLLPKQVWAIRARLELSGYLRDLALFNVAIDSKLRGCDLVKLAVADLVKDDRVRERVSIVQSKTKQAPLRQIAENAGVDGSVVAGKIVENTSKSFGYDAQSEQYGDMLKDGVIDPTKVVRIALEYAASVAGLLITTEAMVADKPTAANSSGMPDMGGMGGMGGIM